MRRRIQIALFVCLSIMLSARLNDAVGQGVEASFSQINSDSLISVYTKKMHKYMNKENKASEVFSFTKDGIEVYQPATDTSSRKLESTFLWKNINDFKKAVYISDSQKNIRIALDPGHIAGDIETAKMEKKWVEMKNPPLQLIEGELTLATANILKKKLEKEGATVMLTRDNPNQSSFGIEFKIWKDSLFIKSLDSAFSRGDVSFEENNFLRTKANDAEIFRRFFLTEDLRERARKINAFNPDLTLIIHYNVDETNKNWNKPTKRNFNMVFVGGSFIQDELDKPEARIDFLRQLLTDDIEQSIDFSKHIIESLVLKTGVPAALDSNAVYLKSNCISTDAPGVFCRNLALTRMVKGTLCYGESLYQDNINECKALSKKDASTPLSLTNGIKTSKRVEEVAEGYFQGIMNYAKNKKK